MVDVSSSKNSITITVGNTNKNNSVSITPGTANNSVTTKSDTAQYWSKLSRDYSEQAKTSAYQAEQAKDEVLAQKDSVISDIEDARVDAVDNITTVKSESIASVEAKGNEVVSAVNEGIANIEAKSNEANALVNTGIANINTVKTEAVNAVTTTKNNAVTEINKEVTDGKKELNDIIEAGGLNINDKITNCLLEVPQNIKLELNNGTLTLKAGSKVVVPNGSNKFDELVIMGDKTATNASNDTYMVFVRKDNNGLAVSRLKNQTGSGTSTPTSGYWSYYNTTDNKVYRINDGTVAYQLSFPIAIVTVSNGAISSIDQVFNGFGYIGGHVWVDKGVKFLQPNGINADGTLNNIERTTTKVAVTYVTRNNQRLNALVINTSLQPHPLADNNPYFEQDEKPNTSSQYYVWFDTKENLIKNTSNYGETFATQYICCAGKASWVSGKVSQLVPKQPVRLLTYDDIKVNNPYFFGQYIWSEFAPSNLSWLKSSGQWNSGTGYQSFYDWALSNANANKAGFKLSTASYTDYDFVVNTSAKTFRLPVKVQNAPMGGTAPVVGNGIGLGFTDGNEETAINLRGEGRFSRATIGSNVGFNPGFASYWSTDRTIGVTTDPTNSGIIADLSKATNSKLSLYFYVGETVKDPTLINVAQIASNFADKIGRTECKAYITETYSNGTSWYRVWSPDSTGKRFCEQCGHYTNTNGGLNNYQSINLLKTFANTDYSLQITYHQTDSEKNVSFRENGFKVKNTDSFTFGIQYTGYTLGADWRACGYIN